MPGLFTETTAWRQWTQRTQVPAAGTDVVRAWLAEEPFSVPAAVIARPGRGGAGAAGSDYDASAHLSEETSNASVSAARGIVRSIWVSWIACLLALPSLYSATA